MSQGCFRWLKTYRIGLIGCALIALIASIPVYGLTYLPSLDGPNHWAIVMVIIETLRGQHPALEFVFIPGYKLFYVLNAPLFLVSELIGFTSRSLPSISTVFLQILFSFLVGMKYIQVLSKNVCTSGKIFHILSIILLFTLTLFASLAMYSAAFYWGFLGFVFSVPFAVLSILVLEDCIYASNRFNIIFLATLLFLSYAAHPLSIFFLTIWTLIRALTFCLLEFAKGTKFGVKTFAPFGVFFLSVFILTILHHISFPGTVGLDFDHIIQAVLHPFRPMNEVYGYLNEVFTRASGFTAGHTYKPSIYSLVGLFLILGSVVLNLLFGGWNSLRFQIGLTIILFLIINASFIHRIIPSHYPIGVFFRDRLITICFPIAFTLAGYSILTNRELMKRWMIVSTISIIVGFGALYHIRTLYDDYRRFNNLSREVYREMMTNPNWDKDYANRIYFKNRFHYRFGEHFIQYACLHDGICKGRLFHETYPNFGIYPLRPVK